MNKEAGRTHANSESRGERQRREACESGNGGARKSTLLRCRRGNGGAPKPFWSLATRDVARRCSGRAIRLVCDTETAMMFSFSREHQFCQVRDCLVLFAG